jgi:hypothetical protein
MSTVIASSALTASMILYPQISQILGNRHSDQDIVLNDQDRF